MKSADTGRRYRAGNVAGFGGFSGNVGNRRNDIATYNQQVIASIYYPSTVLVMP